MSYLHLTFALSNITAVYAALQRYEIINTKVT